jgi:hypothetical protein
MRKKRIHLAIVLALILFVTIAAQPTCAPHIFNGGTYTTLLAKGSHGFTWDATYKNKRDITAFKVWLKATEAGTPVVARIKSVKVKSPEWTDKNDFNQGNAGIEAWLKAGENQKISENKTFSIEIEFFKATPIEYNLFISAFTGDSQTPHFIAELNMPEDEFFAIGAVGDLDLVILVGCSAAAMDIVSATMLAAKIGMMAYNDPGYVSFTEPSSSEENEDQSAGYDQVTPVDIDDTELIMLDTELDFAGWKAACDYNLILVGGPVANIIVKQLIDEGFSVVNWATSPGEWEYIEAPYGNCDILIIAGADRDATRQATQDLIDML